MIAAMNRIADLVGGIGNNCFDRTFYSFCHDLLQVDQCTVFRFDQQGVPQCLIAEAQDSQSRSLARQLASEYTEGAYRRDPNLALEQVSHPRQVPVVVRCVSPSSIQDRGYRRRFYDEALVRQELAMIAPMASETLYCSFYRTQTRSDFAQEDAGQLQQLGEILAQMLGKHAEVMHLRNRGEAPLPEPAHLNPERRARMLEDLRASLLKAPGGLTRREAEICASIALGYTTLGISLNLGISMNTVATHRKRAYAKLGISSQNELFARYFDSLNLTPL
jgi:DNA-binding CsgD family transcriptional regulator